MAEERKVCVVTGSSSGIGAATVKLYAKQGWNVVVNFSREAAPAEAVASECRELGADVLVARADISADADCKRLAGLVEARFGRADVLVNNAGTTKFVAAKDLDGLDADDFQRIYAVNVVGAFQITRALVPMLSAQPGAAIVNVSSIAALMQNGLGADRYAATVQGYRARSALDAVISPDDVAEAAWFLGVKATKTTGEVLLLDAGLRLTRG